MNNYLNVKINKIYSMLCHKFHINKNLAFLALFCMSLFFGQNKTFTIVLDAGHGGHDHGANRVFDGVVINEKDVTLSIAKKVNDILKSQAKDAKIILTRNDDNFVELDERAQTANRHNANLFVSIHCNSSARPTAYGTETYVLGVARNKENMEIAKKENAVIMLEDNYKQKYKDYNPNEPESFIGLKINQTNSLQGSLKLAQLIENNFINNDKRFSRGIKQAGFLVLRKSATAAILIETGFINHGEEGPFLGSEEGQLQVAKSISKAILDYKALLDRNRKEEVKEIIEIPLKNDMRILLFTSTSKVDESAPQFNGLKYILPIKDGDTYKYYYGNTNLNSVKEKNLKTAKDAGFKLASPISFIPNVEIQQGYYTIELAVSDKKLSRDHPILQLSDNVERNKNNGIFYYTYGKFKTLEDAINFQKELAKRRIENTVIQKVVK